LSSRKERIEQEHRAEQSGALWKDILYEFNRRMFRDIREADPASSIRIQHDQRIGAVVSSPKTIRVRRSRETEKKVRREETAGGGRGMSGPAKKLEVHSTEN